MSSSKDITPVALVFGTRPEAVKLAPIALALRKMKVDYKIFVTAQHRSLLDQTLDVFGLSADVDLDLMRHNQKLTDFGARALKSLGKLFRSEQPSMVIVQGDTSTVFFGALAAFYEHIPVGHVEAGLRSFDMRHPFPEEGNRALVSRLASLHFAPTNKAKENLLNEGIVAQSIHMTGNTAVDSLKYMARSLKKRKPAKALAQLLGKRRKRIAITAHRRENFGKPLESIFRAFRRISLERPDVDLIYPVHPNPNIRKVAERIMGDRQNIHLLPPLDYLDFTTLLSCSHLCLTDSGGVQEEAPSFALPILVLRETTERPEGVAAGCSELVGSDEELIVKRSLELLSQKKRSKVTNPYGDGKAGMRIAGIIKKFLYQGTR